VEHRDALDAAIAGVSAGVTGAELVERLDRAGIANARMNTVEEFLDHPQLRERGRWRSIGSPAGEIRTLAPPFGIEDVDTPMLPVPALGAHTDGILGELGVDAATIAAWRRAGVV
jgi:crotonobetainyl-CoA:carnitine CoA-transferase CaiB-like acyl-CoA transferase